MAVAELPLTAVTKVTRTLESSVARARSPFTLTEQVQDFGGDCWVYEIEFAVRQGAEGRRLAAFFAGLRGGAESFIFRDPFIRNPAALGAPQVNGGSQTGRSLVTDGWAGPMQAGDFFQLGALETTRLYQLTADVAPSGGAATLEFVPALRASPADNTPLNVTNPGILLRVTSPIPAAIDLADLYRFSVTAREAI